MPALKYVVYKWVTVRLAIHLALELIEIQSANLSIPIIQIITMYKSMIDVMNVNTATTMHTLVQIEWGQPVIVITTKRHGAASNNRKLWYRQILNIRRTNTKYFYVSRFV